MADGEEEQFSLCWNNYNTNLSTGFHESLVRGDLVDVTLAAEGQLVKAHRLVLSVCSPYFQQMFTTMPANQHAFVFLKDVPHAALKDLIQFMYCGEVNVKQDALPTFISTAEALQIKGLTENGDTQSAPVQMPSTQTHVPIKQATSTPVVQSQQRPRTVQQRNVSRSYKLDSEDSSDDKAATIMVSQKRVLPRSAVSAPASAKRIKTISSDPLEQPETSRVVQSAQQGTSTQIVQVTSAADVGKGVGEPEFIDLPIETIPTKAEPDYGDDGDVEQADDAEATYVEDESYGDMKYDESYFTEGEDTTKGASASGFGDSYNEGDTSANEAQGSAPKRRGRPPKNASKKDAKTYSIEEIMKGKSYPLELVTTKVGGMKAAFQDYCFDFHFNRSGNKFWRCLSHVNGCPAKIMSKGSLVYAINLEHTHSSDPIIFVNTTDLVSNKTVSVPSHIEPTETIAATIKQPTNLNTEPIILNADLKEKLKQRFADIKKKMQKHTD
ncbi:modifier of mdg4-like isoform X2 [Contarinia nasturtii]|uniref:modifier of mdg4-like isoform X2 n=1 Tax=Contarinia nasturtii TaxID=265458 RepID=UPI0012D454A4|nr:modifier of mdg4-like isoform X2 [Contarinia nasturtii]